MRNGKPETEHTGVERTNTNSPHLPPPQPLAATILLSCVCGICAAQPQASSCSKPRSVHRGRRGQDAGLDALPALPQGLRCRDPRPSSRNETGWTLPRPGIEPLSPALVGGFLSSVHQGSLPLCLECHPEVILFHFSSAWHLWMELEDQSAWC